MTSRKRALVDHMLTALPSRQCMSAARALTQLPALEVFREIACANVAVASATTKQDLERAREAEALRFYDTALDQQHDTINVVVGGRASGKMTKLRALAHMSGGHARFITGDLFRDELRARFNIVLRSQQRPIVVIAGAAFDLPPICRSDTNVLFYDCNVHHEAGASTHREVLCGEKTASVALAIDDESDVLRLALLGVRLNVLRLDEHEYHAPEAAAFVDADNAAMHLAVDGHAHLPPYISHADMLPLLSAGGDLFAAWRALVCAKRSFRAIQQQRD
jgi:hypothetical protein